VTPALTSAAPPAGIDNVTFGQDHTFRLEYSSDGFGMRSHGVVEVLHDRLKMYALPQSGFKAYSELRPEALKLNPIQAKEYERQEVIGSHQIEGSRLWFGKAFYDSEGMRGVGAFGYFDTQARRYQLFSPHEVASNEISAMLVEHDQVGLALDHFGEDISTVPGGLVCWNRETHQVRQYKIEFVVRAR